MPTVQVGPPLIRGGSHLSGGWEGQASCPPNPPLRWDFSHLSGGWEGQASVRRQIVIIVINFNRRKLKNPTSATLHYI